MNPIETERLVIRRLSLDDAEFIVELLNDPAFIRFIGDRGVRTPEDARAYLQKGPLASYERFGFGLYLTALKTDGTPIGICGLLKRDMLQDVDIGFAFLPRFVGQGYANEAAIAVMDHGKNDFALKRLVAVANSDNESSIKLLEKLGLRYEQMVRLAENGPDLRLYGREL